MKLIIEDAGISFYDDYGRLYFSPDRVRVLAKIGLSIPTSYVYIYYAPDENKYIVNISGSATNNSADPYIVEIGNALNNRLNVEKLQSEAETLDNRKEAISFKLKENFSNTIKLITSKYAEYELESWETQRQEWVNWSNNNKRKTPYIDQLAASRGISRLELLQKVGRKVTAIAAIQGQQHAKEDAIAAATNHDELDIVNIDYEPLDVVTTELTLDDTKQLRIMEAREYHDDLVATIESDYADFEKETWTLQTLEWSRWKADNTTATPYIDIMAAASAKTSATILAEVEARITQIGTIQGSLRAIETLIKTATTIDAVNAIDITGGL